MDKDFIASTLNQNDSFSSHTHLLEKNTPLHTKQEYQIPQSYGVDRVCLMSVNVTTVHAYWEVTQDLLARHGLNKAQTLHLLLKNEQNQSVASYETTDLIAKHYFNVPAKKQNLYLDMGVYDKGKFLSLMRSNKVTTFNAQIIYPSQSELKWLSKKGGLKQVLYATMMHFSLGMSSKHYKDEIAFLEKFSNLDIHNGSSSNMQKDS